jgi:NAD(P)-dependent dehydrogenase (short-subunit alcohol dehydrogenase family)
LLTGREVSAFLLLAYKLSGRLMSKNIAVVMGVGPFNGLGAALASKFAASGLKVIIAGRSIDRLSLVAKAIERNGAVAVPMVIDATSEQDIERLFESISRTGDCLEIAAYNVDQNSSAPLLETDVAMFTHLWQQNSLGAFLFGREAVRYMLPQSSGTLFFTGATASLRARPPFTAFAAAKAAVRALAQGMAREFGPHGIHVVHAIIDGVIDGDRAREKFSSLVETKGTDGLLKLEAIADTYWAIHQQHSSAWTHELDLRPFKESF